MKLGSINPATGKKGARRPTSNIAGARRLSFLRRIRAADASVGIRRAPGNEVYVERRSHDYDVHNWRTRYHLPISICARIDPRKKRPPDVNDDCRTSAAGCRPQPQSRGPVMKKPFDL